MADIQKVTQVIVQAEYDIAPKQKATQVIVQTEWDKAPKQKATQVIVQVEYDIAPEVASSAASSVGETTARLNGNLTSMGLEASVNVYFEYKETGAGSWTETSPVEKTATGTFYADVAELTADTYYEFRAVVLYDTTEKAYGSTLAFKTTGGTVADGGLFFCNG